MMDLSWMIGLPVGFITYAVLRKTEVDERTSDYLSVSQSPSKTKAD